MKKSEKSEVPDKSEQPSSNATSDRGFSLESARGTSVSAEITSKVSTRAQEEKKANIYEWVDKVTFQLLLLGMSVGRVNFLDFPMLTFKNGGWLFVFVYIFGLLIVGVPMLLFEVLVGHLTRRGITRSFFCYGKAYAGIGFGLMLLNWHQIVSDTNRLGFYFYEVVEITVDFDHAVTCPVDDNTCNSYYSNVQCMEKKSRNYSFMGKCIQKRPNTEKLSEATLENMNVEKRTSFSYMEISLVATCWLFMFLMGLMGTKKLQYVLAGLNVIFLLLIFCVCGRLLSLGDFSMGLIYMADKTDVSALKSSMFWSDLTRTLLHSMGIGVTGISCLASFRPKTTEMFWPVLLVSVFDIVFSLLGLFVTVALVSLIEKDQARYLFHFWDKEGIFGIWSQVLCTASMDNCSSWLLAFIFFSIIPQINICFGIVFVALAVQRDHFPLKDIKFLFVFLIGFAVISIIYTFVIYAPMFREAVGSMGRTNMISINLCLLLTAGLVTVVHAYGETELLVDMCLISEELRGWRRFIGPQSPIIFYAWKYICPIMLTCLLAILIADEVKYILTKTGIQTFFALFFGTTPLLLFFGTFLYYYSKQILLGKPVWVLFFPTYVHPAYQRVMEYYIDEWNTLNQTHGETYDFHKLERDNSDSPKRADKAPDSERDSSLYDEEKQKRV